MKGICILLVTVTLLAGMVGCSGTPSEDLEIRTWYDLDAVRDNLSASYLLMNDLDSTTAGYTELASPAANDGKGWEPIGVAMGYNPEPFTGTFDGQGHEIKDLFINRPAEYHVGLFGDSRGGVIENVGMVNVAVTSYFCVGGLAGLGGNVSNSYSTGSVIGEENVGGLIGAEGTVSDSHSSCDVSGNTTVGGLIGELDDTVINSYSTGNVTGTESVGGLIGISVWGSIINSYYSGNVIGEKDGYGIGGLLGYNCKGTVTNSYSTGDVTAYGECQVGGLVGINDGTINNSYASSNVTGTLLVGGLVSFTDLGGIVTNSFWDIESSGQSSSDGGTGKNTTEMKDITTFLGATWDIVAVANPSIRNLSYIWNIVDDETYPFLSWEPVS